MTLEIQKQTEKFDGTITRNGTSLCVNIPVRTIKRMQLQPGDEVDLEISRHYIEMQKDTFDFLAELEKLPDMEGYGKIELVSYLVMKRKARLEHKTLADLLKSIKSISSQEKKHLLELEKKHLGIALNEVTEEAEKKKTESKEVKK